MYFLHDKNTIVESMLVTYLVRWHTSTGTIISALGGLELIPGHYVNEEVKLVVLGDGHGNVVPLYHHKKTMR